MRLAPLTTFDLRPIPSYLRRLPLGCAPTRVFFCRRVRNPIKIQELLPWTVQKVQQSAQEL